MTFLFLSIPIARSKWVGLPKAALCLLIILVSSSTATLAQEFTSLRGAVTDSSGAVVVGANVTLTSAETSAARTTTTTGNGTYQFQQVSPGVYIDAR